MTEELYDKLRSGEIKLIIIMPDGQIFHKLQNDKTEVHIVAGSFDPLHDAHKNLFNNIHHNNKYYEMSLIRFGKSYLTFNELQKRIKQFEWYSPIIIMNEWRYCKKLPLINTNNEINFHIGFDTAERLINTETKDDLDQIKCYFHVYSRGIDNEIKTIKHLKYIPKSFIEGIHFDKTIKEKLFISSTNIRNGQK